MAQKKVIEERRFAPVRVLESEQPGIFRFEAVVSEADHRNRNRRIYPEAVLFPAFLKYNEQIARQEAAPGLVDHPMFGPSSVSDIGIVWEAFFFEGKRVLGRGRTVPTAKGRDLQAAMEAGVPIGFSTRGYGESEEVEHSDGPTQQITAYELATVDAVVDPSVGHARLRKFTKEETEQMEEELQKAQELAEQRAAEVAAQSVRADEAVARAEGAEARVVELTSQLAEATARAETAESRVQELESDAELERKLKELTDGHRFAATIIAEARELGVTLANVENVVARLRGLVEAAAGAANDSGATPRGELSEDEDAETTPVEDELTESQREELRAAGLL